MFISDFASSTIEKVPLKKKAKPLFQTNLSKVILIAGPTACGKTSLSLKIAKTIGGEIVSADAMQIYRGMDIGTAKVSEEERAQIPHYLIDIRKVTEPFNVVDFYFEAKKAIQSILARNKVPIVVGGSGFYFHSLLYGPPKGPPPMEEIREQLEKQLSQQGPKELYERLKNLDPEYAKTITPNDRLKIIRGLEIVTITGKKVSELKWNREHLEPTFRFSAWFLHRSRQLLYRLIDERCDTMLEAGFLDEVKALEKEGLRQNSSASQAIGYRQALEYLDSPQKDADWRIFVQKFKTQSRHFAKRQFTWFRKEPLFRWLNVEVHDYEIAADMIIQDYERTI